MKNPAFDVVRWREAALILALNENANGYGATLSGAEVLKRAEAFYQFLVSDVSDNKE